MTPLRGSSLDLFERLVCREPNAGAVMIRTDRVVFVFFLFPNVSLYSSLSESLMVTCVILGTCFNGRSILHTKASFGFNKPSARSCCSAFVGHFHCFIDSGLSVCRRGQMIQVSLMIQY